MLISSRKHQLFPIEFLEYIVRHYNGILRENLLFVSLNRFEIRFEKRLYANYETVVSLFSKLVEVFKTIKDKYHLDKDIHTKIQLQLDENDKYYNIRITGIYYIPPGKLFNLFGLILWYHINYKTGQKPSSTPLGKELTEKWRQEEDNLRFLISKSTNKNRVLEEKGYCYICGEEAWEVNVWEFKPNTSSKTLNMETTVCKKHKRKLI